MTDNPGGRGRAPEGWRSGWDEVARECQMVLQKCLGSLL
jgi:hypothetical protein